MAYGNRRSKHIKSTDDHIPIKKLTSNEISRNTVLIVILQKAKKLMHQCLFNNDVSVFYLEYFSPALSYIRMIVRSSSN